MKKAVSGKLISRIISIALCFSVMLTGSAFADSGSAAGSADLKAINIGDFEVPLQSGVTDYTAFVPYIYHESDFDTIEVPEAEVWTEDPSAVFDVTYPDSADGGVITVTVENGSNVRDYNFTLEPVGKNYYLNGNMEQQQNWTYHGQGASSFDYVADKTYVGAGNQSGVLSVKGNYLPVLKQENGNHNNPTGASGDPSTALKPTKPGFDYLFTALSMVNESCIIYASWNGLSEYNRIKHYAVSDENIASMNPGGNKRDGSDDSFNGSVGRFMRTISIYREGDAESRYPDTSYNCSRDRTLYIDEVYASELTVASLDYTGETSTEIPSEGEEDNKITLAAEYANAYENSAGMEYAELSFETLGDYPGISIDGDTLYVSSNAQAGSILIKTVLKPNFKSIQCPESGDVITKVTEINISGAVDRSKVMLNDIRIGNLSIPGFSPTKRLYNDVCVPYTYTPNDGGIAKIPEITWDIDNPDAAVTVSAPENVNGATVNINVSYDGIENNYVLKLKSVGQNLVANPGFEKDGGWDVNNFVKLNRVFDTPGAGSASMRVKYTPDASYTGATIGMYFPSPSVTGEAGKTYLFSTMICNSPSYELGSLYMCLNNVIKDSCKFYSANNTRRSDDIVMLTKDWQRYTATAVAEETGRLFTYYTNWSPDEEFLIDDYYIGELVVSGIQYKGDTSRVIPETEGGKTELYLESKLLNQFGASCGLEDETIEYSLRENYPGVSVEDGKLIVDDRATEGTIYLTVSCTPTFSGSQGTVVRNIPIKLVSQLQDKQTPKAKRVTLSRRSGDEYILDASYYYFHAMDIPENGTEIHWYASETENGSYSEIAGSEGQLTYTVAPQYEKSYIYVEVTPKDEEGRTGLPVRSAISFPPLAPTASDVKISGIGAIGQTYTGSYTYSDFNGDPEENSEFAWLISDSESGTFTPIEGETEKTYVIRESDAGKYVKFQVTPKTSITPKVGSAYTSPAVLCTAKPYVTDVKIKNSGNNLYVVTYNYHHALGVKEGDTEIKWSNGKTGTSTTYYGSGSSLSVTVTPSAELEPKKGDPVTASISISSGGGGSSSIGFRGGGGGGGVRNSTSIVPIPEPTPEPKKEPVPEKYWAEDGINFVLNNGIMQNRAENDFGNSEVVTRAEFIYYVIKALGETETAYRFEFADVSGADYFSGALQKAVDLGIISKDTMYNPARNVSREETGKILVTALSLENADESVLEKFTDKESISEWARGYIAQSVSSGMLKGVSETEFNPHGTLTREQTAVLLKRLYEYKNGGITQ